jgi:predicted ATPase with chaperone activity
MMRDAQQIGQLSAKGVHRVLCVARTVADLDGRELVEEQDVSLALSFHSCRKLASRTHEDAQSA